MIKEQDDILARLIEAVHASPGNPEAHYTLGYALLQKSAGRDMQLLYSAILEGREAVASSRTTSRR